MDTIDKIRSLGLYVVEKDGKFEVQEYGDFVYNKVKKEIQKVEDRSESGLKISGGGTLLWCNAVPSTESAYVEQLEAKAHELYGEIKDGDRFWIDENLGEVSMYDCEDGFSYWKEEDLLYFGNYAIYSKGKWAKKVGEPVRVKVREITMYSSTKMQLLIYSGKHMPFSIESNEEFKNHIEECVEAYFNGKND